MPSPRELLRQAGIGLELGPEHPGLLGECARVAGIVRSRGARSLGLLPAGDDVAVPPAALALAHALARASPRPVGVVDVQGSWPGARALVGAAGPDNAPLALSWLDEGLAFLTMRAGSPAAPLAAMNFALEGGREGWSHLLFDLTGLDHRGDHVAVFDLLDGVAVVARSGQTTTRQLWRRLREIPEGRRLGVLLTGL
jgi:hypothetical protein